MRCRVLRAGLALGLLWCLAVPPAHPQQNPSVLFAVITKVPKDKSRVTAQVADVGGAAEAATLIPSDAIADNPVWRKLEICYALKVEAWKNPDGYRIVSVRVLDAGMLPMSLQSIAGDCLIRKALELSPTGD
ncbi:MAG TPA: hypothetical protein VGQ60_04675 [Nitrospiraceae bacterium]|jgi:hypothetical protein|nr:hypothetical protein [Nitrospiraceae bacterium]